MRLIDADELKKCVLKWLPQDPCGKEEKEMPFETDICVSMLMEIDEQPTIQPEIVRCKDCEHGVLDDGFPHQYFCVFKGDEWNNADYFCGHAKRREVTT